MISIGSMTPCDMKSPTIARGLSYIVRSRASFSRSGLRALMVLLTTSPILDIMDDVMDSWLTIFDIDLVSI